MNDRKTPSYRIDDRSRPNAKEPGVFYFSVIDTAAKRNHSVRFKTVEAPRPATKEAQGGLPEGGYYAMFEPVDANGRPLGTIGQKLGYIIYDNTTCRGWLYTIE